MSNESETSSSWFVLTTGFKVQGRCPACHSHRISYYKVRRDGLKGISPASQGLTPVCIDCGKCLPTQSAKPQKVQPPKKKGLGSRF